MPTSTGVLVNRHTTVMFMGMSSWVDSQNAFEQAAGWFARVAPAGRQRLDETALGEWTVRDLLGHTSRALLTVESYLDKPAESVEVASAAEYFRLMLSSAGDPAAVAQRGRDAGAALGDDPAGAVATIVGRVCGLIGAASPDDILTTPVGGMRLVDYLPSRTFELTVHTCDLAAALGQVLDVPELAANESLAVLGRLAARTDQTASLLLAATGRRTLPAGFSVL